MNHSLYSQNLTADNINIKHRGYLGPRQTTMVGLAFENNLIKILKTPLSNVLLHFCCPLGTLQCLAHYLYPIIGILCMPLG